MTYAPHPDTQPLAIRCAVITISDTRSPETDRSGQLIQQLLQEAGHQILDYVLIPDEPKQIQTHLRLLGQQSDLEAIIL
ncbi:MAG TPA: molybdopterin-binding protein, partial [Coleofasciculaceae cyanobacterium]